MKASYPFLFFLLYRNDIAQYVPTRKAPILLLYSTEKRNFASLVMVKE